QLPRVELDLVGDERLILRRERTERVPVEPLRRDGFDVTEILRAECGDSEELRAQRLRRVVETDERIELRATAAHHHWTAASSAPARRHGESAAEIGRWSTATHASA